jgi:hypothetical protein
MSRPAVLCSSSPPRGRFLAGREVSSPDGEPAVIQATASPEHRSPKRPIIVASATPNATRHGLLRPLSAVYTRVLTAVHTTRIMIVMVGVGARRQHGGEHLAGRVWMSRRKPCSSGAPCQPAFTVILRPSANMKAAKSSASPKACSEMLARGSSFIPRLEYAEIYLISATGCRNHRSAAG